MKQPQYTPVPWQSVVQAVFAVAAEASRRGEMFPQTADEQREDRRAVTRVAEMVEWYATRGGAVAEKLENWPRAAVPAVPAVPAVAAQASAEPTATELALIEKAVLRVGIKSLLNYGAGSLVYSEGVEGVTQQDLVAYTREIALHCAAALTAGGPQ